MSVVAHTFQRQNFGAIVVAYLTLLDEAFYGLQKVHLILIL